MPKDVAVSALTSLAVADFATSPTPAFGAGSIAWSSTTKSFIQYDGSTWRAVGLMANAQGSLTVLDAVEVLGTATTLNGVPAIGATSITVTSTAGLVADQFIQIGANGATAEITQITSVTSGTVLAVYPAIAKTHGTSDAVAIKAQRQVMSIGDGTTAGNKLAISAAGAASVATIPDTTTTGTITATDAVVAAPGGAGVLVSGASTAGSLVALALPGGLTAWNVQITGLTSGTLYFEESLDSTTGTDGNWIAVNGRQTGIINTVLGYSTTSNGIFRGNISGGKWFRVRSVGALTGTPAIIIRLSDAIGAVFQNASTPAGTNSVGNVGLNTGANLIGRVQNQATATGTYSAAALTTLSPTPKYFSHVIVTGTLSTVSTTIYDNASAASGTIIGVIPAGTAIGTVLVFAAPVALGATVGGAAGNAAFTYVYG